MAPPRTADARVFLLRAPSVYRAQNDTWLLADALEREPAVVGGRVLEVCAGSGALAVAAARLGADSVTAGDISRRAVASSWLNARMRGLPVRVRRGDLFGPVKGELFDVILANPPYVPAAERCVPLGGAARSWDAGVDGRAVLERLCREAPAHLAPGGVLLMVFSALCGVELTVRRLEEAGLAVSVVARRTEPFGPVMNARIGLLEAQGLIAPGQRHEELVVLRGQAA
ncbi:MAG TPA: HemK2/MTQ2 family protein methyltransferase [Acidimicrobiales bacterium]|nr:HemK2/MTQ2 family protein methyltransferase [Acidimicrobiales bacterium]